MCIVLLLVHITLVCLHSVTSVAWLCDAPFVTRAGAAYDMSALCKTIFHAKMPQPIDAELKFSFVERSIDCGQDLKTSSCIYVPGLPPTSAGDKIVIAAAEEGVPGAGVKVVVTGGTNCESMRHKNRTTTVYIKCPSNMKQFSREGAPYLDVVAHEGKVYDICDYFMYVTSYAGCPLHSHDKPTVTSVTGCTDSEPKLYTQQCAGVGGSVLNINGLSLNLLGSSLPSFYIGDIGFCESQLVNDWTILCNVVIDNPMRVSPDQSYKLMIDNMGSPVDFLLGVTISFNAVPRFAEMFDNLSVYGIGGMKRQTKEIYEKVFLSRGLPAHVVKEFGMTHVKGLILQGPPGTGKTHLARAIASIMNAKHVKMVNAPELLNKYVGESESNLRTLFADSENDWRLLEGNSPFHVIIIDEIDAVCKPRGRDMNNLGNLVYDSVVNQLLTKMDGLSLQDNVLVIGMTNRFELLDQALLRPGRFEVNIQMTLPNEQERFEIFNVILKKASSSGRLAEDVDLKYLVSQTAGFTPAQIAGVVRSAQSKALASYAQPRSVGRLTVSQEHFLGSLSVYNYNDEEQESLSSCSSYKNIIDVTNSTLPRSALVQVEKLKYVSYCLKHLIEKQNYFVKIIRPDDFLNDVHLLSNLHRIPSSVESQNVAVIVEDLCHMLGLCFVESSRPVNSFLLSMRAVLNHSGSQKRNNVLVGICSSSCEIQDLKKHFSFVFGMVSYDSTSYATMSQYKTSNKTTIASKKK